jgi:hypothetical protein
MTLFRPLRFLLRLALAAAPASAQARSASPIYEQIGALVQGGLDALARGDTAAYLDGTGKAFAIAPRVPPVAYHHARAHALARRTDSALALLTRLATEGAVVAHEAPADSAFDRIRRSPEWSVVAARIEASRQPISTSSTAFELPERDLLAEARRGTRKTRTLYLSSLYKRRIVAISPDGTTRDFIRSGDEGIGPVAGLEVDPVRRGCGPRAWCWPREVFRWATPRCWRTACSSTTTWTPAGSGSGTCSDQPRDSGTDSTTVMPKGDVYITDSQSGGVYKLGAGGGEIVEVLPPGTYTFPNGITRSDDGRLLVVALLANATGVPLDQTVRRVALSFLTPPAPAPPPRHPRASAQAPPPPAAR